MRVTERSVKVLIIFFVLSGLVFGIYVWHYYPFSSKNYKGIALGMPAAEAVGDSTGLPSPEDRIPESAFYVYALGDEDYCIGPVCGIGGYFIECLDGWISGSRQAESIPDEYTMSIDAVYKGKERVITIADKNAMIVGIYPGARIRNLPYIMRKHRDLVSADTFKACSDLLPRRWE